jgi:formylglycine-generating enzyme required for sulfatase activity
LTLLIKWFRLLHGLRLLNRRASLFIRKSVFILRVAQIRPLLGNLAKWVMINGADWAHPEGPTSSLEGRWTHPVVHVSHGDAERFCKWAGKVLGGRSSIASPIL